VLDAEGEENYGQQQSDADDGGNRQNLALPVHRLVLPVSAPPDPYQWGLIQQVQLLSGKAPEFDSSVALSPGAWKLKTI